MIKKTIIRLILNFTTFILCFFDMFFYHQHTYTEPLKGWTIGISISRLAGFDWDENNLEKIAAFCFIVFFSA